jgi:hypothetical protein
MPHLRIPEISSNAREKFRVNICSAAATPSSRAREDGEGPHNSPQITQAFITSSLQRRSSYCLNAIAFVRSFASLRMTFERLPPGHHFQKQTFEIFRFRNCRQHGMIGCLLESA